MGDFIDKVEEARAFTAMDVLWGCWNVKVKNEDENKTTYISHYNVYRYNRMTFDSQVLSATFRRALDNTQFVV